jgi:hypothetical protein
MHPEPGQGDRVVDRRGELVEQQLVGDQGAGANLGRDLADAVLEGSGACGLEGLPVGKAAEQRLHGGCLT